MAITVVVTELSYRFIEMPIRHGAGRAVVAAPAVGPRPGAAPGHRRAGAAVVAMLVFAVADLATAQLKQNEIAQSLDAAPGRSPTSTDLLGTTTTTGGPTTTHDTGARVGPPRPPSCRATTVPVVPTSAPPSTVPATVPPTAPPSTIPANPIFAIGDSVMLGAPAEALKSKGIVVDAVVSRQMKTMVPVVQELAAAGKFGTGRRRPPRHERQLGDQTAATDFFTALSAVPKVLVADHPRRPRLRAGQQRPSSTRCRRQFPNVTVARIGTGSANECPGDCFYNDGTHLAAGRPAQLRRPSATSSS